MALNRLLIDVSKRVPNIIIIIVAGVAGLITWTVFSRRYWLPTVTSAFYRSHNRQTYQPRISTQASAVNVTSNIDSLAP